MKRINRTYATFRGLLTKGCISIFFVIVATGAFLLAGCGGGSSGGGSALTAPSAPTDVAVTAADESVTVTWKEVAGATSYNMYWSNKSDVSKASYREKMKNEKTPCTHTGLTNGLTYYYVVTAIGVGGESEESLTVGATPKPGAPNAPQGVTATVPEESINLIQISWDSVTGAASYNIYWDVVPGVTKATGNKIENAVSPYNHTGLLGRTTYYYAVSSVDKFDQESGLSAEVSAMARGPKLPTGGGDTGYGNNLSVPVVFADGYGITGQKIAGIGDPWLDFNTGLRPTSSDTVVPFPYFDPESTYLSGGVVYYPQQTASTWQAAWLDGSGAPQEVSLAWGDNLQSQAFKPTSVVRIETVLSQDMVNAMEAYTMKSLYGSQRNEIYGADTTTYVSTYNTVFAVNARLIIQKLDGQGGNVANTVLDKAVYESFGIDGPGGYSAEINVSGKLIYGYSLQLRNITGFSKVGWWRLTFALDPSADIGGVIIPNNTAIKAANFGTFTDTEAVVEFEVIQ